jgi:maleamate amidohydrolase
VAAEVRSLDMPVIYTKWAYSDESPPSLAQKSIGMVLHQSDEDAAVHPELKPEPEDTVLCKTGFSAFSTPALDDELQARGVENLLITGVMSEFGIRATALAAVDAGYRPLLIKDCCAGITSESHRAMMSGMTFATMKARSTRELLLDLGGLENEDVVLV